MDDLISRKALLDYLDETVPDNEMLVNQYNADWIYSLIENAPTIEAEPVKHGRWLQPKHGECFCSECLTNGSPQWKRCPVCEAKMYGGDAGWMR